jgi:predicted transposase/invertase (TIGR01784 family)
MTNRSVHEDFFEDLQIVLIELPKWRKLNTFDLEKPQDRWLMYFSDPNMFSILSKEERERFNEISEAIEVLETKNFTPEQIRGYELYIDNMRAYVTTMSEAKREGMEKGMKKGKKEGIAEGKAKGKAEGIAEGRIQIMDNTFLIMDELKDNKLSIEQIAKKYNVNIQYVQQLKKYSSQ